MRQMPTRVKVSDLRKGDRFSFIPAAWHGPGVVREVSHSGDCWCLKFSNWQIINPPGVEYTAKETSKSMKNFFKKHGMESEIVREQRVRLLGRFWHGEKGYCTY